MSSQANTLHFAAASLLFFISACSTAQTTVCDASSFLGQTGPEICVSVSDTSGSTPPIAFRVPAAAGINLLGLTVGEYTIDNMTIAYASGPTGMALSMGGQVTRTSPGSAKLSIVADAGRGGPLNGTFGSLNLDGTATGISATEVGGGGWTPLPSAPQDVQYKQINRTVSGSTLGAGPFSDTLVPPQPLGDNMVGVHMQTVFSLNDVGASTTIPAGVGIAPQGQTPPEPDLKGAGGGKPHYQCYRIDAHDDIQQRRGVKLKDQFESTEHRIGRITQLCAPVNKNDEGLPDPKTHLVCYEILKGHDPKVPVETRNQFGLDRMHVRVAEELCVPSTKSHLEWEQKEYSKQK